MNKNELAVKEFLVNPLSGEFYDPKTGKYIGDSSPFSVTNENFMSLGRIYTNLGDVDLTNASKCMIGTFDNRVEFLLINILKEYEAEIDACPYHKDKATATALAELREKFAPVFNLLDYEQVDNSGVCINHTIAEFMINYMVTTIMNSYLKNLSSYTDNDEYAKFMHTNFMATSRIAIRLYSMFETIFKELETVYKPAIALLYSERMAGPGMHIEEE